MKNETYTPGKRIRKKKLTFEEKCDELLDENLDGAAKLSRVGEMSDRLGEFIESALKDSYQFNRHIVTEKGGSGSGATSECVEKVFDKVDFKSVKEAAGAIKALAESVRCVYSIPDFKDLTSAAKGDGAVESGGVVVTFESGEEYAK